MISPLEPASAMAAVVVWFEPLPAYVDNLASYAGSVGHTWIIDNSATDHSTWVSAIPRATYVWLGRNRGIARALNEGCRLARDAGYEFVLTMDQDSSFSTEQIQRHIDTALMAMEDEWVAIVACGSGDHLPTSALPLKECRSIITSGNLVRLLTWAAIGGFDAKLFIDQVDHEFCYRLRRHGYRILVNSAVAMHHQVGDPVTGSFLGRRVRSSNHGWLRRYYHMRNSLYLRQQYPEYSKPLRLFLRDVRDHCLGILLLEQQAGLKLGAMALGVWDFFRGRYGDWDDIRSIKR